VKGGGPRAQPEKRSLRALPTKGLPLVVAARMSAGFPGLFTPIPLWRRDGPVDPGTGQPTYVAHPIVDGGVSSNFPVSSFDSWVPGRPTFGLRLRNLEDGGPDSGSDGARRRRGAFDDPVHIGGLAALGHTVFESLIDAEDNLMTVQPTYRERIIDIRLPRGYGGTNFYPTRRQIEAMLVLGRQEVDDYFAGTAPGQDEPFDFGRHQLDRYQLVHEQLELNLQPGIRNGRSSRRMADVFATLAERVAKEGPRGPAKVEATSRLLAEVNRWSVAGRGGFAATRRRGPRPVLRLGPD
jgi:hypothetical protein